MSAAPALVAGPPAASGRTTPYDVLEPPGPTGHAPARVPLVTATGLAVRRGGRTVVSGVDLTVHAGEVVGLVGRNGAGKTSLLRALLGLVPVAAGGARVAHPRSVGVAHDTVSFPLSWSARDGLTCLGQYLGLPDGEADRVERALDRAGLPRAARDRPLAALSHGMRQMVSVAAALLGDPRLVVLDEPHNGLDPLAAAALGRLLRELADEGRGVLVSSHLVDELDRVCDRVAVLQDGHVVLDADVADVTTCEGWYVEAGDAEHLLRVVAATGRTARRHGGGVLVDVTTAPGAAELAADLVRAGAPVSTLRPERRDLVDVVRDVLGRGSRS